MEVNARRRRVRCSVCFRHWDVDQGALAYRWNGAQITAGKCCVQVLAQVISEHGTAAPVELILHTTRLRAGN